MSVTWRRRGGEAVALVDATGGAETVQLPLMASLETVIVRRLDGSGNTVTVTVQSGKTLDGATNGSTTVAGDSEKKFIALDAGWESLTSGGGGGGGAVDSVVGRTGVVTGAHIAADPGMSGTYTPKATTITAGAGLTGGGDLSANRTLAVSYGSTAGTAAQGNDARLSDARTPTAHVHSAADVTSGTVAAARLGSGTANSTTFLRGDGTWAAPAGGGATAPTDRGAWATATSYAVRDVATQGGVRYECASAHTSGTFSTDLAANRWVALDTGAAVPLAQAGQTPSQDPVSAAAIPNVGSQSSAARADHVHPYPKGPGFSVFLGSPPSYNVDLVLDGSGSALPTLAYPYRMSINPVQRSGSTWTAINSTREMYLRDLTIAAGYTLRPQGVAGGLLIHCSGTLTVAGTIDVSGESPAAGAAPAAPASYQTGWFGWAGGSGGTGVGAAAPGNSTHYGVGGGGGSGGASGATSGGAGAVNHYQSQGSYGLDGEVYLIGHGYRSSQGQTTQGTAMGGLGGGAGAGDGTNKGGSGGSGGGCLIIIARKVVIASTGVIKANGGNGAPGAGGNAGGGGGGGGGVVSVHTLDMTLTSGGIIQAAGGAGGAGVGTGAAGSAGAGSGVFSDPPAPPTSWGYAGLGAGVIVSVWQ